jgi:hypothetical protein
VMSQPPTRPYQGRRYRTDDPYDASPGQHEPVGGGYRPPGPRQPDGHNGYGPYDADGRGDPYGGRYDRETAYGGPDAYQRAYDGRHPDEPAYSGYGPDAYDPHDERAYGRHEPEPAYYGPEQTYGRHEPAYGPHEPAYESYADPRYRPYAQQPPAPQHPGYGRLAGWEHPTAAYHRVDPLPALDEESAARPSRRSRKVLLVLAVVLVLVVGAGTAFVLLRTDLGIEDSGPAQLTAPDTLAGRPKITDGELQALAEKLVTTIKKNVPEAVDTVGAFYGEPAKKNMIMVAGASGRVSDPVGQLDRAMREMAKGGLAVRQVASADPGPLGGVAKCGDATADDVPMGVCAWSDRGSLVMVVVYFTNGRQASADLAEIRGAIERRG